MEVINLIKTVFPGVWELVVAVGQIGLGVYSITEGHVAVGYGLIATGVGTLVGALRK